MVRSELDRKLKAVISSTAEHLKPHDFVRQGNVLRAVHGENAAIVEFQRSDRSSGQKVVFTVNVGVVCRELLDPDRTPIERSSIVDAHLRIRLGELLEPVHDTWWEIDAATDEVSLTAELSHLLIWRAVPYLEQFRQSRDLIALWKSGQSPGLTDVQRSRFLAELEAVRRFGSAGLAR